MILPIHRYEALGCPTRRHLVEALRDGPRSVAELAERLPVSRPAVSQHLRILLDAGIVRVTPVGRQRLHALDPGALAALRADLDALWSDALGAFARHLDATEPIGPATVPSPAESHDLDTHLL